MKTDFMKTVEVYENYDKQNHTKCFKIESAVEGKQITIETGFGNKIHQVFSNKGKLIRIW
jgi:hypothetical protein